MEYVEFIETPTFSRKCKELLTEDEYRQLQEYLTHSPDAGAIIVGTGGCRKIRWMRQGQGKSDLERYCTKSVVKQEIDHE